MKKSRITAVVILVVGALIGLFGMASRSNDLGNAANSIETLYSDRLVAANYVFQLSDLMHRKRVLVEKLEQVPSVIISEESLALTPLIKNIIDKYPETEMLEEERALYLSLRQVTADMAQIEGEQLYSYEVRDRMRALSAEALITLRSLADIQVAEGKTAAGAGQMAVSGKKVTEHLGWSVLVIGLLAFIFALKKLGPQRSGLPAGRPYLHGILKQ